MMKRIFKLTAIAFISPALLTVTTPSPVKAGNQFDICVEEMVDSGVDAQQAHTACADALIPKELSLCVEKITQDTAITPTDALQNCYRVRRPVDLAFCVVDIEEEILQDYRSKTNAKAETTGAETTGEEIETIATSTDEQESPLMLALDSCRSSLLPARHSECVIALSRTPEAMSPIRAMKTCLNAEDFPRDLFPSY